MNLRNKGIPRLAMPQLSGIPLPGTRAAGVKRDPYLGGVDLGAHFWLALTEAGVKMHHYKELAAALRPTQAEMNCEKVAALTARLRAGTLPATCLFISSDYYIVDGHHRWAAELARAKDTRTLRIHKVHVSRADLPICDLIERARAFALEWGLPQQEVKA